MQQFSGYRPFPDMAIDGKLTLIENIADLGGLSAAFDAYRLTLGDRDDDPAYVRASRIGSSSSASRAPGAARSATTRCASRSPPTTTRRRRTASRPFATSTPGTRRSTCARGSASISNPRRGCGSGEKRRGLPRKPPIHASLGD